MYVYVHMHVSRLCSVCVHCSENLWYGCFCRLWTSQCQGIADCDNAGVTHALHLHFDFAADSSQSSLLPRLANFNVSVTVECACVCVCLFACRVSVCPFLFPLVYVSLPLPLSLSLSLSLARVHRFASLALSF